MMERPHFGLRTRLLILLGSLAIVPLVGASIVSAKRDFSAMETQAGLVNLQLAQGVADQLHTILGDRAHELEILEVVVRIERLSPTEQESTLESLLAADPMFRDLALLDPYGMELVKVARDRVVLESDLTSRASDPTYLTSVADLTTEYGPVAFDPASREPQIELSHPMVDQRTGQSTGAIFATIRFRPIWDLLAELEVDDGRTVFVTDRSKRIVAHPNPAVVLANSTYDAAADADRWIDADGVEMLVAEEPLRLAGSELTVVVTQPVSVALAPAMSGVWDSVIATVVVLIGIALAGMLLTARLIRPIETMADSARALASGDFTRRVESATEDEIGDLSNAFNHLVEELSSMVGRLEQLVEERTTELRDATERQADLIAELEARNAEMELIRTRLEELLLTKNEFLGSVSHEIRTPLASVVGFAAELRDHFDDFDVSEQLELIGMIAAQGQDMTNIINDLLVAARAEAGNLVIERLPVDLAEEVDSVLEQTSTAVAKVRRMADSSNVVADPVRVRQVLRNLIVNADRYGGPEIEIHLDNAEDLAVLRVIDNGSGIPQEDWENVFEPYTRAHDRRGQPASVGLGLTVSRTLARQMGGDLTYRYEAGRSVFELALPTRDPQDRTLTAVDS